MIESLGNTLSLHQIDRFWCGWVSNEFVTLAEGGFADRIIVSVVWSMAAPTIDENERRRLISISRSFLNDYKVNRILLEDYLLTVSTVIHGEEEATAFVRDVAEIVKKGDHIDGYHCVFCGQPLAWTSRSDLSSETDLSDNQESLPEKYDVEGDQQVLIQGGVSTGCRLVHRRCHERYERRLISSTRRNTRQSFGEHNTVLPYAEKNRSYYKGFWGALLGGLLASLLLLIHEGLLFVVPFIGAFLAHRLYEKFSGKWGERRASVTSAGAVVGMLLGIWLSGIPSAVAMVGINRLNGFDRLLATLKEMWLIFIYTSRKDTIGFIFRGAQIAVSSVLFYNLGRVMPAAYRRAPLTYQRIGDPMPAGETNLSLVFDDSRRIKNGGLK
ncbi:MAG: hypothetical protein ACOX2M_09370 [Fastidiosipilaceae bacterium]|jgi:hypothetical protein